MSDPTIDGVSPSVRYASYGVYALGGSVIVGAARGLMALGYIISNYVCQKLAEHHRSKGILADSGYQNPQEYKNRIKLWATTEGVRALKEISWIGGIYLAAKEATNFSAGNFWGGGKGVSTWGHMKTEKLLAREGFYEFWGVTRPNHANDLQKSFQHFVMSL